MTENIRKQITDRYYKDYFKRAAQGPGLRAKLARSWDVCTTVMAGCAAVSAAVNMVPLLVPAAASAAFALGYASLTIAVGIGISGTVARHRTKSLARKNIAADIDNGQLLNRYKDDLIADEYQKLASANKMLPVLRQVSMIEDFQNVTDKRAEINKDLAAKRAKTGPNSNLAGKKTNSLK